MGLPVKHRGMLGNGLEEKGGEWDERWGDRRLAVEQM